MSFIPGEFPKFLYQKYRREFVPNQPHKIIQKKNVFSLNEVGTPGPYTGVSEVYQPKPSTDGDGPTSLYTQPSPHKHITPPTCFGQPHKVSREDIPDRLHRPERESSEEYAVIIIFDMAQQNHWEPQKRGMCDGCFTFSAIRSITVVFSVEVPGICPTET
ncbi:hypothetical protein KIN20_009910 [Parelaphostrongylus tenuis]|uniref:Uncharacterized protein n=1 Tax=Parelaphostrongylus tenuis TaxID=148309 RepID=A0AAD5QIH7_PARTN|nr:hypothetical protein KIN20_009910 [Parelaphostrongylus tenuis]